MVTTVTFWARSSCSKAKEKVVKKAFVAAYTEAVGDRLKSCGRRYINNAAISLLQHGWQQTVSEFDPGCRVGKRSPSMIHIRMEPGAFIPAHLHKKAAEVLCILDGDFINEDKAYGSGDFLHSKPGTVHGPHTTKRGCSLLVLYTANTGEADPNDFFLAEAAQRS
jgi:quercetin dioxygenase-like cupin family protein